jgi:cytochrome c553
MKVAASCLALLLAAMHCTAADLAAGAAKAEACAACHGKDGVSQMAGAPSLAGQPDGFLQWQLVYFRSGTRKNEVMQPIAASLSDDDIRNLAAHFAALKPPPRGANGAAEPAMFAVGQRLAQANRCAACHKDDYSGEKAAARTGGQREDYLLKSLRDFKSGARTGGGVAAMADAVYPLGDDQLRALAHFMAHRP